MEDNKEKKRLQSVSHAVQKIREKEEEQKQQGLSLDDKPKNPLAETEIAVPQEIDDSGIFAQEADEENIEDESLYESSDSTYESLFLTKSMTGKAEGLRAIPLLPQEIQDARLNTSTIQDLQEIKKTLNKQAESKPSHSEKKGRDEMEELEEAEQAIAIVKREGSSDKEAKENKEVKESEESKKKSPEEKEKKASKKISPVVKEASSKENPVQDKPGEIRRDKSLMECKEEKPKHPAEKKEDKVSKEYTHSWFAHPIPAFYFFLMFIPLLIVFFIFAKRDSVDAVPLIKTGFATQEDFEPVLMMEGKIASLKNEIFSFSQGIVTEILCKEGDFVRKGDALVRLSNPIAKEELQQAKHLFSQAVLEWQEAILQWDAFKKRQEAEKKNEGIENFSKKLEEFQKQFLQVLQDQDIQNFPDKLKEKRISLENSFLEYYKTLNPNQSKLFFWEIKYHSAYQQVLSSFLNWKQKESEGKSLVIPSPDNGQVHALFIKLNMPVSFGTKIANISLSGAKWIEAKAKEAYVPYLNTLAKTELKADIQFPFADITSLKEERVFVSCSLQNDSAIYIKLVADKPKIPDGTLVSLKIVLPVKKSCIQVMKQAVVFQERLGNITPFVFSLKTEKDKCFVKEVPVVLGMLGENSIEVLHGLTGQETIVLFSNLGMKNLFTEMTVRVCNEE